MGLTQRTLQLQRRILAIGIAGAGLVFWRGSYDVFNTVKITWITVAVIASTSVGALRVSRTRRLVVPRSWFWVPIGVFTVALLAATVTSETPLRSFVGDPGRHTGSAAYLLYVLVLALVVRTHLTRHATELIVWLLGSSVPIALYALVQAVDLGPFDWRAVEGGPQIVSTFGNADFLAAWLAITVPLSLGFALRRKGPSWRRWVGFGTAALAFVASLATGSLQGAVIAPLGALVVGGAWLWSHPDEAVRSRRRPVTLGVAGIAALGALIVLSGLGPFAAIRDNLDRSVETRTGKWAAATAMVADRPLLGVGMDAYGDHFHAYRSAELATTSGLRRTVDDPHDVVLAMATGGGMPLALGYLAILATVGLAFVRALRRDEGDDLLLTAALGGAWLAYHVQSLVSIDVPPVAVLPWAFGGVLLARGLRPSIQRIELPGAPTLPATKGGGKRARAPKALPLTRPNPVLLGVIGLVTIATLVVVTRPLRADLQAAEGRDRAGRGEVRSAVDAYGRASATATWEGQYAALQASLLAQEGDVERAIDAVTTALAREPRDLAGAVNLARLLVAAERTDEAGTAYDRVLELDPETPEILAEVGAFHVEHGDPATAVSLLTTVVERRPDEQEWVDLLARAEAAQSS